MSEGFYERVAKATAANLRVSFWQPIETAPRDGSVFLTLSPGSDDHYRYDFAEFDLELEEFVKHGCGWRYATHWMPLPEPPQ